MLDGECNSNGRSALPVVQVLKGKGQDVLVDSRERLTIQRKKDKKNTFASKSYSQQIMRLSEEESDKIVKFDGTWNELR